MENYAQAKIDVLKSLLLTLVVGLWIYWLWSRRRLYWFAFQMPGLFGLPLLGIFVRLRKRKKLFKSYDKIYKELKSNSVLLWLGLKPVLLTTDLNTIERVLSSNDLLHKASFYRPILYMVGGSLLVDEPKIWRHNRKVMAPSLSHKMMLNFFPIFHKANAVLISKFDKMIGKGEQKILETLMRNGLGISLETTMGYALKEDDDYDEVFIKNVDNVLEYLMRSFALAFFNLDFLYRRYYPYDRAITNARNMVCKIIEDKIKKRAAAAKTIVQSSPNSQSEDTLPRIEKIPNIFLDIAIDNYERNQFTMRDTQNECGTILLGSFETTSVAIFSVVVMLAMHPEYQERLFEQIFLSHPEKDFKLEYEEIKNLPYLTMIINETMRIIPPIPLFGRHVTHDFRLTDGLVLPQGLDILIDIYHLHRRPDIWGPNADKFNPDNFLPENLTDKHTYAFIPFSKGLRNCIGYQYAYQSVSVLLSGLVRNFRFTTSYKFEDLNFYGEIGIKYVKEPGIEIHRREV